MNMRCCASLLGILMALPLAGCNTLQTISIVPGSGSTVLTAAGQTAQYKAVATYQMGSAAATTSDVTSQVTWAATSAAVATINSSGLATAVGTGNTPITAEMNGQTATSDLTVTLASTPATTPTLNILPGPTTQIQATAAHPGETVQFLAIGNLSGAGTIQDLTNQVRWVSSDVSVATINQSGLATAAATASSGNTTITAIATTSTGAALPATSILQVDPATGPASLPTLTVYKVGVGTGTVTSTTNGIFSGISCGPQATCTGDFPLNTPVTLTAAANTGSVFGGWSSNCVATPPILGTGANAVYNPVCVITLPGNDSVGAIFNTP
ncbi:MAG TPA: Ig-like domain-containing protein [Acidobacteriaceae bacterium]